LGDNPPGANGNALSVFIIIIPGNSNISTLLFHPTQSTGTVKCTFPLLVAEQQHRLACLTSRRGSLERRGSFTQVHSLAVYNGWRVESGEFIVGGGWLARGEALGAASFAWLRTRQGTMGRALQINGLRSFHSGNAQSFPLLVFKLWAGNCFHCIVGT
jgi:hypothetical protein